MTSFFGFGNIAANPDSPLPLPRANLGFFFAGPSFSSDCAAGKSSRIRTGPFSFFLGAGRFEVVVDLEVEGAGRFRDDLGGGRDSKDEEVDEVTEGFAVDDTAGGGLVSESESDP